MAFVALTAEQKAARMSFAVLLAFLMVFRKYNKAVAWGKVGRVEKGKKRIRRKRRIQ